MRKLAVLLNPVLCLAWSTSWADHRDEDLPPTPVPVLDDELVAQEEKWILAILVDVRHRREVAATSKKL